MSARTNRRAVSLAKPAARRVPATDKAHARSRLSNGRDLLPDVDGRSVVARRYRDIIGAVISDQGGSEHLSEVRLQLIRRFSGASVLAEQMEARVALGEQIDMREYSLLVSTIVRVAQRLGLERRPRNVIPSLGQYLSNKQAHGVEGEPAE
jgi:hypothetical protein